jgi:hypothetical protein
MPAAVSALVAILLSLGLMVAAPIPKKPVLYYPTTPGTKWVMDCPDAEIQSEITAAETRDGVTTVTRAPEKVIRMKPGGLLLSLEGGKSGMKLEVSEQGVFLVEAGGEKRDPPFCTFGRPGGRWEHKGYFSTMIFTARPADKVTVPAGTFEAIPVDGETIERNGARETWKTWWAPGVGLIKSVDAKGNTVVMKSFTPGKE